MIKINSLFLLTSLFILNLSIISVQAQNYISLPAVQSIDPLNLAGKWHAVDTNVTIEFIDTTFGFMLRLPEPQIYYFDKDSTGKVLSSGYFPNWPPFNCNLELIHKDTLRITYSQMEYSHSVVYVAGTR